LLRCGVGGPRAGDDPRGELILLDAKADEFKVLGRLQVLEEEYGCYAHPAFLGTRVYMRGDACILCVDLSN
jgi:outer membrane protein assembly factor BamB